MTRTLEAELKLKAVDLTGKALTSVSRKLGEVERKAAAVTRAQGVMGRVAAGTMKQVDEAGSALLRFAAPTALAYGSVRAFQQFAVIERQMTRIGITADASRREIDAATAGAERISQDVAMPIEDIRGGIESLVSAGKNLTETMALLPAVARTAQASGSNVADVATTAVSVGDAFHIAAGEMEHAFDIMATGGKIGRFEMNNLAQELPSLAPAFAAVGESGVKGLTKAVAMLQIIREQSGTASEAATAMKNVLQKMETEETVKKFKKGGIDLRGELAKIRREGGNVLDTFLELSNKLIGGDLSKIPIYFTDSQLQQGVRALLTDLDRVKKLTAQITASAPGTVDRDLKKVLEDSQSSIDQIKNASIEAATAVGEFMKSFGVVDGIRNTTTELKQFAEVVDAFRKQGPMAGAGEIVDMLLRSPAETAYRDEYVRASGGVEPTEEMIRQHKQPFLQVGGPSQEELAEQAREAARRDVVTAGAPAAKWSAEGLNTAQSAADGAREELRAAEDKLAISKSRSQKKAAQDQIKAAQQKLSAAQQDVSKSQRIAGTWAARDITGAAVAREEAEAAIMVDRQTMDKPGELKARLKELAALREQLQQPTADRGVAERGLKQIADEEGEIKAEIERRRPPAPPSPPDLTAFSGGAGYASTERPFVLPMRRTDAQPMRGRRGEVKMPEPPNWSQQFLRPASEVEDALSRMQEAIDPAAFASAGQDAGSSFTSGIQGALAEAKAIVAQAAAEMSAMLSFTATPTVSPRINAPKPKVNADLGYSMGDLGAP